MKEKGLPCSYSHGSPLLFKLYVVAHAFISTYPEKFISMLPII